MGMEVLKSIVPWCLLIVPLLLFFWFGARRFNQARKKSQELIDKQIRQWQSRRVSHQCIKEWTRLGNEEHVRHERAWLDNTRHGIRKGIVDVASKGLIVIWTLAFSFLVILHLGFLTAANAAGWFGSSVPVIPLALDTASRGAFFDLMESYDLSLYSAEPEPKTLIFSTYLFAFRSAWSIVSGALIFSFLAIAHDLLFILRYIFIEYREPAPMTFDEIAEVTHPARLIPTEALERYRMELSIRTRFGFDTERVQKLIVQAESKLPRSVQS